MTHPVAKIGPAHSMPPVVHAQLLRVLDEAAKDPSSWVLYPTPKTRFFAADGTEVAEHPEPTDGAGGDVE